MHNDHEFIGKTDKERLFSRLGASTGYKFQRGPINKLIKRTLTIDLRIDSNPMLGLRDAPSIDSALISTFYVGAEMEETVELMKAQMEEARKTRGELEQIANQVKALGEVVRPILVEQINEIRALRFGLLQEIHAMLNGLKDVRKFFLEKDYQLEVDHLERFVKVCQGIRDLQQSGVFDAVTNAAIRLALMEEKNAGK